MKSSVIYMECPFCKMKGKKKEYMYNKSLVNHIKLYHNKATKITLIAIIISLIAGFVFGVYSQDIRFEIDRMFGIEPELYTAVSIYYPIKLNTTELKDVDERNAIIEMEKKLGLIPDCALERYPYMGNINDENNQSIGCTFFYNFNAESFKDITQIPEEIRNKASSWWGFTFIIPPSDFFSLLSECGNCFGYLLFTVNDGSRVIDEINLRICLEHDSDILYSSNNVLQESNNCFRLWAEKIEIGKNSIGYVIINKNRSPSYEDFWGENIFSVCEGRFRTMTKSLEIDKNKMIRTIHSYFPGVVC